MLAQTFSCGQAASASASMRSVPVVKAPTLPCRRAASSALLQTASAWLCSTSKWRSSSAMVSGNTARATRMAGFMDLPEPDEGHDEEQRDEDRARPGHVAEEA